MPPFPQFWVPKVANIKTKHENISDLKKHLNAFIYIVKTIN